SWVVTKRALRARDEVDAVVRARAGHGVLEYKGAPLGRLDEACVHVSALVGFFPFGVAVGNMFGTITSQPLFRGAHRYQGVEFISAVDIHVVRHRTEAMRRIEVTVPIQVIDPAPQTFALGSYERAGWAGKEDLAKVMDVGRLSVDDFAKNAGPNHVQDHHLVVAV